MDDSVKKQKVQDLLDKWIEEYKLPRRSVIFREWKNLDHDKRWVLGNCTYVYRNLCEIRLSTIYKDRRFGYFEKSVLWHEMAHAITYLEDGINDDHNIHWRATKWKKPHYAIGDAIGKIWFCFVRIFRKLF